MSADAVVAAIRLRRFWLEKVVSSSEFLASDLAGEHDLRLRRVGPQLVVSGRLDFGQGDPFAGELGDLVRAGAAAVSADAVRSVVWRCEPAKAAVRRAQTTDLDILDVDDPPANAYAVVAGHLRRTFRDDLSDQAREALRAVRVAAVSRHRLWFAVGSDAAALAIGKVPGARGALVTAVQRYQGHEKPLYRLVVDRDLGRRGPVLLPGPRN